MKISSLLVATLLLAAGCSTTHSQAEQQLAKYGTMSCEELDLALLRTTSEKDANTVREFLREQDCEIRDMAALDALTEEQKAARGDADMKHYQGTKGRKSAEQELARQAKPRPANLKPTR